MNAHQKARLTDVRCFGIVQASLERRDSINESAASHGFSAVTAHKWIGSSLFGRPQALLDKSSRQEKSPRAIEAQVALAIVGLRRRLCLQA